jgi:hypothetical protein
LHPEPISQRPDWDLTQPVAVSCTSAERLVYISLNQSICDLLQLRQNQSQTCKKTICGFMCTVKYKFIYLFLGYYYSIYMTVFYLTGPLNVVGNAYIHWAWRCGWEWAGECVISMWVGVSFASWLLLHHCHVLAGGHATQVSRCMGVYACRQMDMWVGMSVVSWLPLHYHWVSSLSPSILSCYCCCCCSFCHHYCHSIILWSPLLLCYCITTAAYHRIAFLCDVSSINSRCCCFYRVTAAVLSHCSRYTTIPSDRACGYLHRQTGRQAGV